MLTALNSGFDINVEAFKNLGVATAKLHIELYDWFKIPQSMHRLWFHVPQIADKIPISLGHSSEEAIESSHKCLIKALNNHARQNSYENMTLDMGHNRLINTDPCITEHFGAPIIRNKKNPVILAEGVKKLLKASQPANLIDYDNNDEIDNANIDNNVMETLDDIVNDINMMLHCEPYEYEYEHE